MKMSFLLNKTGLSALHLHQRRAVDGSSMLSSRRFHVKAGGRENALLAKDPSLTGFKSYKQSVRGLKKVGDVLTLPVHQ